MSSSIQLTFVCLVVAVFGLVSSVPTPQQQQQEEATGGYSSIFWSVLDDCFGGDEYVSQSTTVCLKSKALTALDRALSKPTVTIVDGMSLAARTGKSLQITDLQQTDRADRAALDAAQDSDQKNALLDDMLANRVDQLVSTRTIVMDTPADQEGRGKKKDKSMKKAMMMMGMMIAAVMGPMAMKMIGMLSIKALVVGKIALVLSLIMLVKKLMSQQKQGGGMSSHEHEPEPSSYSPYGRSIQFDAHNMAYSGQKQ